jgi:hypothetical protein
MIAIQVSSIRHSFALMHERFVVIVSQFVDGYRKSKPRRAIIALFGKLKGNHCSTQCGCVGLLKSPINTGLLKDWLAKPGKRKSAD